MNVYQLFYINSAACFYEMVIIIRLYIRIEGVKTTMGLSPLKMKLRIMKKGDFVKL